MNEELLDKPAQILMQDAIDAYENLLEPPTYTVTTSGGYTYQVAINVIAVFAPPNEVN